MEAKHCSKSFDFKPIELETISMSSSVLSKFSMSWSNDNKLAIIVEEGIFIFELWPTPLNDNQTFTFMKYFISSSTIVPENCVADSYKCLWNMNRKNAFELALDPTMSTLVDKVDASYTTRIIQCEFSPIIMNDSYISCLTNIGLVQIFKKDFRSWIPVFNITKELKLYYGIHNDIESIHFNKLKIEINQLKVTYIKWYSERQLFFLTSNKSGDLFFWSINISSSCLSMKIHSCVNLNFQCSALDLAYCNEHDSTLLIANSSSGLVKGFFICVNSGSIYEEFTLWSTPDCIASDLIKIESKGDRLIVFVVKRHLLLVSNLKMMAKNKVTILTTKCLPFTNAISGFSKIQDYYVLSLMNHIFYSFNIEFNENLVNNLNVIDIEIKTKLRNAYNCYGLGMTQNKVVWIVLSSAKLNYDSLKDVTIISLLATGKKNYNNLQDSTCCGIIDQIVKNHKKTKLCDIYDFLELKRLELLSDGSKFKNTYECNDKMPVIELKSLLWEAKLKQYCNSTEMDALISELEISIAKKHSKKLVKKYRSMEFLSNTEKKSLETNLRFLSNTINEFSTHNEECSICGNEIIFDSIKISKCSNNHQFPRCCISLLPCDEYPYLVCQKCDSVALAGFVMGSYCLFCDGLLISNTRLEPAP